MSSGGSPYDVPLPIDTNPGDPTVLETEIRAAKTPIVDIGHGGGRLATSRLRRPAC